MGALSGVPFVISASRNDENDAAIDTRFGAAYVLSRCSSDDSIRESSQRIPSSSVMYRHGRLYERGERRGWSMYLHSRLPRLLWYPHQSINHRPMHTCRECCGLRRMYDQRPVRSRLSLLSSTEVVHVGFRMHRLCIQT